MAGNNLLHFLRGGLGKATDTSILEPGQPFYNYKKNYLTIGGSSKDTKVNGKPLTVREVVGYKADNDSITSGTEDEFHLKYSNNALELLTPDNFTFKSGKSEIATYSSDNSGKIELYKPISSSYSATYSSLTINGNTNCQTCLPSSSNTYNLGSSEKSFKTLYVNNLGTTLKPSSDNSYDLGSYSKKFKTLYVGDILASSIQNSSDIIIKTTSVSTYTAPSIELSSSTPYITMSGIIKKGDRGLDIGEFNSPIGTVYADAIKSETIDTINERLNELGFKQGNITAGANTIGYVAQLGTIVYGCIWKGLLLRGEQSFTIDSLISPCPKSTSVGAIPCTPIASSTGNVVRVPCSINENTITTNTGSSSYTSKSNADFYFWYDTNTDHKYPNKTS